MQGIELNSDHRREAVVCEIKPRPKLTIRIPKDSDDHLKLVTQKKEITVLKKTCSNVDAVTGVIKIAEICTMIFFAYIEPKTLIISVPYTIWFLIDSCNAIEE
jgi:hypothetical protein